MILKNLLAAAQIVCCGLAAFVASLFLASTLDAKTEGAPASYTILDLGEIRNLAADAALGLSDAGQVAGWHAKPDGTFTASLWDQGHTTDLELPAGYRNSTGRGVNSNGEVVGWINTSTNPVDSQSVTHAWTLSANP